MKNPCMNCEKRSITCHSECEAYLEFHRNNLKRHDEKLLRRIAKDYTKDVIDKHDHRLNRKKA